MNTSASSPLECDIVIVGAGMVGAALAVKLARNLPALRIVLLEAQPFRPNYSSADFDPRVVALTAASQYFLEGIDAWRDIEAARVCPYTHMEVWDSRGTGSIHFDCREVAEPALGTIAENSVVQEALLKQLANTSVQLLCPAKVSAINLPSGDEPALVLLEDGRRLHCALIVATDGANSTVRQMANLETREWPYGHTAIICTAYTEKGHGWTARQAFTPQGPLAFLPLQDEHQRGEACSLVWSAPTEYANHLLSLDDEAFAKTLGEFFEYRLGHILRVTRRFHYPLQQRHCKDYFKPGLVVAGDAAHTIHPLAGQGVNLGFQDVEVLAEEMVRAVQRHIPLADVSILQRYQRRRKGPNLAMMGAMEGFKQLFSREELPLHWLRNEGMNRLAQIPFVKRQLIKKAMGL